jgi:hypothetical protein
MKNLITVLLPLFLLSFPAKISSADPNQEDHNKIEYLEAEIDRSMATSNVVPFNKILHFIHESIEVEDPNAKGIKGLVKNWAGVFNFKEFGINIYRVNRLTGQRSLLKNIVPDVVTMLATSHLIESTSSIWGTSIGSSFGLHEGILGSIAALGVVISVPGLDPLCIGLLIAYSANRRVRSAATIYRGALKQMYGSVLKYSGLLNFLKHHFVKEDRLLSIAESLEQDAKESALTDFENKETQVRLKAHYQNQSSKNASTIFFNLSKENPADDFTLESIEIEDPSQIDKTSLTKELFYKAFGLNIRSLLKSIKKRSISNRIEDLNESPFIKSIEKLGSKGVKIKLYPEAFPLGYKTKRKRSLSCQNAFAG